MSGTILLIGALAIGGRGLNFGIDFKSGTRIQTAFVNPKVNESEVAKVMSESGLGNAEVQKINNSSIGGAGFQISTKTLASRTGQQGRGSARKALRPRDLRARDFAKGTKNFSSTSIGPTFGKTVANSAIIAIIASLLVISAYIALRFEWKYAIPVLIALMHDLLITAGVYSLTGREVTTATVAALLTILGYSLYDTIIVFDRVRENVPRMPRAAFSQIVNRSMSEVLTRSLATSFCTLLPVLALLFFGGETLKDFAFALMVGIASGAYSSIFIASPVLTHWKEREAGYRARRERIVREIGARAGVRDHRRRARPRTSSPSSKRRRTRRGSLIAPEDPGQQISRDEFQELVARPRRRRQAQGRGAAAARKGNAGRAATRRPPPKARRPRRRPPPSPSARPAAPERDPAADLTPEDLVLKDEPKPRPKQRRRATAATGGPADGDARLGDDGPGDLALHDLHARPLLGRHRGRLRRLAVRLDRGRVDHQHDRSSPNCAIPGEKATTIAVVLYAVPGAAARDRAGVPRGHAPRTRRPPAPRQSQL